MTTTAMCYQTMSAYLD